MSVPNTTKSKYLKAENYFWVVWLRAVHPSQKYYSQLWGIYPRLESEALEPTAANLPMVSQDWLEILKSPCWMEYIYIYIPYPFSSEPSSTSGEIPPESIATRQKKNPKPCFLEEKCQKHEPIATPNFHLQPMIRWRYGLVFFHERDHHYRKEPNPPISLPMTLSIIWLSWVN